MPNVVRLKIGGIEYSITADEDEAYIRGLGSELERRINKIQQRSPFLATTMAAIMSAMESLDDEKKALAENEKLRLEVKRLLEETACAKLDAEIARRRLSEIDGNDDEYEHSDEIEQTEYFAETAQNSEKTVTLENEDNESVNSTQYPLDISSGDLQF